jgi:TusA-related sulfurtransferase
MNPPPIARTVDGTLLSCKGAIARLESTFSDLPPGSLVRVLVNEVPNRIDVRAWADRRGHPVLEEVRRNEVFELYIVKGGPPRGPPAPGALTPSP